MVRGVEGISRGIAVALLLLQAMIQGASTSGAQIAVSTPSMPDPAFAPGPWLHPVQAEAPLPPEQRDVLEELIDSPSAAELKPVVELYLKRNIKLSDKDFQTFSKILETTRMLEALEQQRKETVGTEPPADAPTIDEQPPDEPDEPTQAAATRNNKPSPPPPADLDLLYHRTKPMRPL